MRRKSPSERVRERIENAELLRRLRGQSLPDPSPEPDACEKHPGWVPARRGPQPRTPRHMCPFCRDEATRTQDRSGRGLANVAHPLQAHGDDRLDRAWREHLSAQTGEARPGSLEEAQALDRIAELRYAERARERDTFAARRRRSRRYWAGQLTAERRGW